MHRTITPTVSLIVLLFLLLLAASTAACAGPVGSETPAGETPGRETAADAGENTPTPEPPPDETEDPAPVESAAQGGRSCCIAHAAAAGNSNPPADGCRSPDPHSSAVNNTHQRPAEGAIIGDNRTPTNS